MTELLTAAQMRSLEQAAIDSGDVTGLELMERAGQGVVEAIFEEWPEFRTTSHRAVALCGPGNNGGDGFVVARLLKEWGWEVEVFLYGDPDKLPPDARVNYERWGAIGEVIPAERIHDSSNADLKIDALFGTGLVRPLNDDTLTLGQLLCGGKTVAIDAPSGLCLDSGHPLVSAGENAFFADLTVSFHSAKVGHRLLAGPQSCGKVTVVDIGLGDVFPGTSAPDRARPAPQGGRDAPTLGSDAILSAQGEPFEPVKLVTGPSHTLQKASTHKYTHGHAVILSGPAGKGGAARLAARGALRIGAGLVTLAGPASVQYEHCAQITAIMWQTISGAPGLEELLEDKRLNAICIGPGLGVNQGTANLVLTALQARRATVLDADALTRFERTPETLFDALHDACVLTPHAGEFARLFPDISDKLNAPATSGPAYSKVDATREAAKRAGCTVLFKGSDTVISDQNGIARINSAHYDRAAPWLATAGSGDVLAGFITGLLARGVPPLEAASTAAWLHVDCARSFGPGLIAEDLPEELPRVFKSLDL